MSLILVSNDPKISVDLTWENISSEIVHKGEQKVIFNGCSWYAGPGRLVAIMGNLCSVFLFLWKNFGIVRNVLQNFYNFSMKIFWYPFYPFFWGGGVKSIVFELFLS